METFVAFAATFGCQSCARVLSECVEHRRFPVSSALAWWKAVEVMECEDSTVDYLPCANIAQHYQASKGGSVSEKGPRRRVFRG